MRIAVCLKQVPDPATVEIDPLTGKLDHSRLLYIMNPADAAALELALGLCGATGQVLACTVGPARAETVLREALAAGADRVLRLAEPPGTAAPAVTARLLAAALRREELPDLLLCGTRSADRGSGQVPALLGACLGWPVVTDVTQLELSGSVARVQRRRDRGAREVGDIHLPAVLAIEPGTARLRHAGLPGLLAAQRAEIPVYQSTDLQLAPADLRVAMPLRQTTIPPRPRSRTIFTPETVLPAHERIGQILSAGVTRKTGQMLEGPPDQIATAIIAFLRERGFLAHRESRELEVVAVSD